MSVFTQIPKALPDWLPGSAELSGLSNISYNIASEFTDARPWEAGGLDVESDFTTSNQVKFRLSTLSGDPAEFDQTADVHYTIVEYSGATVVRVTRRTQTLIIDEGDAVGAWGAAIGYNESTEEIEGPIIDGIELFQWGPANTSSGGVTVTGGSLGVHGFPAFDGSGVVYKQATLSGSREECAAQSITAATFSGALSLGLDSSGNAVVVSDTLSADVREDWLEDSPYFYPPHLPTVTHGAGRIWTTGPPAPVHGQFTPGACYPGKRGDYAKITGLIAEQTPPLRYILPEIPVTSREAGVLTRSRGFLCSGVPKTESVVVTLATLWTQTELNTQMATLATASVGTLVDELAYIHPESGGFLASEVIPNLAQAHASLSSPTHGLFVQDQRASISAVLSGGFGSVNTYKGYPRAQFFGGATAIAGDTSIDKTAEKVTINLTTGAISTTEVTLPVSSITASSNQVVFFRNLKVVVNGTYARMTQPCIFNPALDISTSGNDEM